MIRDANDSDLHALSLIGAATFLETCAGVLEGSAIVNHCQREHCAGAYGRYLDEGASAWIAESSLGNAPIGYALLSNADLPSATPNDLELKRIYVLSCFHGAGVGRELMDRSLAKALEQGAGRLLLGVHAGNDRAIAFYAKNGFSKIADRRFRVGNREYDDVVLARAVS